ncbi:hypothetical protein RKD19_007450 [Streptomyces canus]
MSPHLVISPRAADHLATFGPGQEGKAARLNDDVPLPGAHAWDRIGRLVSVDRVKLSRLYRRMLPPTALPFLRLVSEVGGVSEPLLSPQGRAPQAESGQPDPLARRALVADPDEGDLQRIRTASCLECLAERSRPGARSGGRGDRPADARERTEHSLRVSGPGRPARARLALGEKGYAADR